MKTISITLIIIALTAFISCKESQKTFSSTVNFEKIEVAKNSNATFDSIYTVSVNYSNPVGTPQYLQDSILKYTKLLFASWFQVDDRFDLNNSVKNHYNDYVKRLKENRLQHYCVFNLDINCEDIYQNDQIISITYKWALYEGGAHGSFGKYCFVLDKKDGQKINLNSLFKDNKEEFLNLAEIEFKKQAGMKPDEKIYSLYRFKNNRFHLPNSFAFSTSGLIFYYNPYEIAPYSAGLIQFVLPFENILNYVNFLDDK